MKLDTISEMSTTDWHCLDSEKTLTMLQSSHDGLSTAEAQARLLRYGANEIKRSKRRQAFEILLNQFTDFMILVLIVAAVISGLLGEVTDTIAIIVIVIVNGIIGFIQEYRAEKAIEALRKMAEPFSRVKRDGALHTIPASEIVPGDLILLEAGTIVPVDMRLLEIAQLKIDEAPLTGESIPVEKHMRTLTDPAMPLGDRTNMAYKGTTVTYGRGIGVAHATGMKTELGKIASMLEEEEEVKTPLQRRLIQFGKRLSIVLLAVCAVVFVLGILRGEAPALMFLTAVSLAVAAIPEALPAVITIALALGAKKLVQEHALMRKLAAVETLGSITYICSDKTGTLTQNKMVVQEIFVNGTILRPSLDVQMPSSDIFLAMALNNDAHFDRECRIVGDPTETALCTAAHEAGYKKQELVTRYPRVAEIPFDSDRKCMTTFHRTPEGEIISYTKGAVEVIEEKAIGIVKDKRIDTNLSNLYHVHQKMAADGLRVLGLAMRKWERMPLDMSPEHVEHNLVILGFVGMIDPPRKEVKDAIASSRTAGIIPVMITGDHPITARALAYQLGILEEDTQAVMTGKELAALSLEEFEDKVEKVKVYARTAPEQKLKIVKALQDKAQFVAMTGDGVNDAPALKRADIGVAMGIMGTEVSKEASHMILLDDNFATIVKAIKEGRRIFDNIRKFIKYILSCNSAEILTIFLAPFFGLPIPLLPIQILWINLVTDSLPALALAVEPADPFVMKRPPRHPHEGLFAQGLGIYILWVGLLMSAVCLAAQAWAIKTGAHWQTMIFTVLCLSQLGNALAVRTDRDSLFAQGIHTNALLLGSVVLIFLLQLATIYVPVLNPIFKTQPLSIFEFIVCMVLSSVVFFAVEIEKLVRRLKSRRA